MQAPVICVMAPPIHLGAWSMLWLPLHVHKCVEILYILLMNKGTGKQ